MTLGGGGGQALCVNIALPPPTPPPSIVQAKRGAAQAKTNYAKTCQRLDFAPVHESDFCSPKQK